MEIDNMQAVIDAARQGAKTDLVLNEAGRLIVLVPGISGHPSRLETIDTEKLGAAPLRKRGTVEVFDAASFNKIMAENTDGLVTVYINRDANKPAVVAVLNGHGSAGPGWADHRASIVFRPTPQWVKWTGIDGKFLSQADFANFIEDNLLDVRHPAAADMLEISQFLEITRTTNFKSVTRPKSGLTQFKNENNDVQASSMAIPDMITLLLSPLFGIPPMEIQARFRYRLTEGVLKLGIKLQRVEEIMAQIMEEIAAEVVLPDRGVMVEGIAPG